MTELLKNSFIRNTLRCFPMSPIDLFTVDFGILSIDKSGKYAISLILNPFEWDNEIVETRIELDFIDFNYKSIDDLSGMHFKFPLNPEKGYIDASVYLENKHNYIDVVSISFGPFLSDLIGEPIKNKIHERVLTKNYIVTTILYKFCWEGSSGEFYPEIRRINTILSYVENDFYVDHV